MRQRISLILTLTAWLLATGSHWDLVQTYAWGRMIADYSGQMTLADAVTKTFSPKTMCRLCRAVADAKQRSANNPAIPGGKSPGKILLVCAPRALVFANPAPICAVAVAAFPAPASEERPAPPSPPPRALA